MVPHVSERFAVPIFGYPAPNESEVVPILHDSPQGTRQTMYQHQDSFAPENGFSLDHKDDFSLESTSEQAPAASKKPAETTTKRSKSADTNGNSGLLFVTVNHPNELKNNKTQMREIRGHVMHTYLDKEGQKPESRDPRVNGAGQNHKKRQRPRSRPSSSNTSSNPNDPKNIFRRDLSRRTPDSTNSNGSGYETSGSESVASTRERPVQFNGSQNRTSTAPPASRTRLYNGSRNGPSLVHGFSDNDMESLSYMKAQHEKLPFPQNNIGGGLEPFAMWPDFFDNPGHLNNLKWSCSKRFGSRSLSMHWIPTMLRARHAFLSTLCISSAHDDIMMRALHPTEMETSGSYIQRIHVRTGVIKLINESLNDPEMRIADETIIAVLHVLNSEVMGCNDQSMQIHQDGLLRMVQERGGLERLGVGGQLAAILTITMYTIAALRETLPYQDFIVFASKQNTKVPSDTNKRLPESPVYYRPQGFTTLSTVLEPSGSTHTMLDLLRVLTSKCFVKTKQDTTRTPSPFRTVRFGSPSDDTETVSTLRHKIFAMEPCHDLEFKDMNARYKYEAIRLAALIYTQALTTKTPFSKAAKQLTRPGHAPPTLLDSTTPLPIQIRNALMRTDTSECWDQLAGVLFWICLVAGAAANPGPLANEDREGIDEDARKWVTAVGVRCCIVLSFEYGHAVLETLKRFVAIERTLATKRTKETSPPAATPPYGYTGAELSRRSTVFSSISSASSSTNGTRVWPYASDGQRGALGPVEPLPGQMQMGFADFAQEFMMGT